MLPKILIGLATLFALYWTIKTKKIFPTIITLGLIVGIVMVLLPSNTIQTQTPGFYVYLAFVALAFIYGLTVQETKPGARLSICLMSASIFLYWLWVLNHWHGNAALAPIFVLFVAIGGVISKVKLKNELGFITLLLVDAIAILIEGWMKGS